MNRILIVCLLLIAGCTGPTTKVAITAMDLALEQSRTINSDYKNLAKQSAIDMAHVKIKAAFVANDVASATKAADELATTWDKISFLDTEYTKTRWGLYGLVDQYIHQQEGFLNILMEKWDNAKAATTIDPAK